VLLWSAACGQAAGDEPLRLRATVVRPGGGGGGGAGAPDTVRFALPAQAHRCSDGRSLVFESASHKGNGILVVLRYGDSLVAGSFPLLAPGDTVTPRGATVAVRYMKRDVAHGLTLDSGVVELRPARNSLGARVHGSGLEDAARVALDAAYAGVPAPPPFPADTVPCRYQP